MTTHSCNSGFGPAFSVRRHPTRHKHGHGFTLYSAQPLAYLKDGHHMGWYKYKRDALARAAELNK